jgi:hypothetical protein
MLKSTFWLVSTNDTHMHAWMSLRRTIKMPTLSRRSVSAAAGAGAVCMCACFVTLGGQTDVAHAVARPPGVSTCVDWLNYCTPPPLARHHDWGLGARTADAYQLRPQRRRGRWSVCPTYAACTAPTEHTHVAHHRHHNMQRTVQCLPQTADVQQKGRAINSAAAHAASDERGKGALAVEGPCI